MNAAGGRRRRGCGERVTGFERGREGLVVPPLPGPVGRYRTAIVRRVVDDGYNSIFYISKKFDKESATSVSSPSIPLKHTIVPLALITNEFPAPSDEKTMPSILYTAL